MRDAPKNGDRSVGVIGRGESFEPQFGLTKREWFAGKALQGILAADTGNCAMPADCAIAAVRCADVLLEQLAERQS